MMEYPVLAASDSKYDLNKDGVVDSLDLSILQLYMGFSEDFGGWLTYTAASDTAGNPVYPYMCDFDGDGAVSPIDAAILTQNYSVTYSKYDLNKDGVVDSVDLYIAKWYYGINSDNPKWDTWAKYSDSKGNPITASLCDVNDDGDVNMFDLLDIYARYTVPDIYGAYDLNKDGKVDSLDMGILQLYMGLSEGDVDWFAYTAASDTAGNPVYPYMCDFVVDGTIDMLDMAELFSNYTEPEEQYSKYDLNKDGVVDSVDLYIAYRCARFTSSDPGWDSFALYLDSKGSPITQSLCDVNGDDVVDILDLVAIIANYTVPDPCSVYDLNKDGVVDSLDMDILYLYMGLSESDVDWFAFTAASDTAGKPVFPYMCDFDGDGEISLSDAAILFENYTVIYSAYDLNKDGKVDGLDLSILQLYMGFSEDMDGWLTYTAASDTAGNPIYPYMCDFDGDGAVSPIDAAILMQNYNVFSKYDLNKDRVIDSLDLYIAVRYAGFTSSDPGWDSLAKFHDSKGSPITPSLCDVNGDEVVNMLDLIDIYIRYTVPDTCDICDFNKDGEIDDLDMAILLMYMGLSEDDAGWYTYTTASDTTGKPIYPYMCDFSCPDGVIDILDVIELQKMYTVQADETVKLSIRTDPVSYITGDVEYILFVRNAADVQEITIDFFVDGNMLTSRDLAVFSPFESPKGILWVNAGSGVWHGTIALTIRPETTLLTSIEPVDIAKLVFAPRAPGEATLTLANAKAIGSDGTKEVDLDAIIELGNATTKIELIYSKYDLNRDGIIDALDLGIMLLYCGFDNDSIDWGTLFKVNDSQGRGVAASKCDVNGDGLIDMLDLIDLLIHYTK
ncbi:MAG: dockerin type I domain-containing protein [Clostridiales bacterium]|nr:dockerin type I domain-containing protein [Clostridiales bacterium]